MSKLCMSTQALRIACSPLNEPQIKSDKATAADDVLVPREQKNTAIRISLSSSAKINMQNTLIGGTGQRRYL